MARIQSGFCVYKANGFLDHPCFRFVMLGNIKLSWPKGAVSASACWTISYEFLIHQYISAFVMWVLNSCRAMPEYWGEDTRAGGLDKRRRAASNWSYDALMPLYYLWPSGCHAHMRHTLAIAVTHNTEAKLWICSIWPTCVFAYVFVWFYECAMMFDTSFVRQGELSVWLR